MKKEFKPGEVVFDCYEYYEGNQTDMWNDIGKFLHILVRNDYVCKVYSDDKDSNFVVVQFHDNSEEVSEAVLRWTTWEELEKFILMEEEDDEEESECDQDIQ